MSSLGSAFGAGAGAGVGAAANDDASASAAASSAAILRDAALAAVFGIEGNSSAGASGTSLYGRASRTPSSKQ